MKIFLISFILTAVIAQTYGALTMEQMKHSMRVFRNICQPKHFVSNESIENIKNGIFPEDRNLKCYIACMLKMAHTMKNGRLNYDATIRQINLMFPENLRARAKQAIDTCKGVAEQYTDICDAAYETTKCIYNIDPTSFVFP